MSAKQFCKLKKNINISFNVLLEKYKITEKDKYMFMNSVYSIIPMRKKTILTYEQRCKSRKQDGNQCSRRHKPNELFCGKHIKNHKYGIFQLKGTSPFITKKTNKDSPIVPTNIDETPQQKNSVKLMKSVKTIKTVKPVKLTKGKKGRNTNPKKDKIPEFLTLKSVQIKDKYYYIDKFHILYNPEPVNGQYEIIGKLKDLENAEIYYATSLS